MTNPRLFRLERDEDETGVSGTGHIAEGVMFSDGTVAVRWLGDAPSTVAYFSLEHALAVNGQTGKIRVAWLDESEPSA